MLVNMNSRHDAHYVLRCSRGWVRVFSAFLPALTIFFVAWVTFAGLASADDQKTVNKPLTIVAFGDSLTAGYGLGPGEGFVDQLKAWLSGQMDGAVTVVNAGVSGDTSAGGASRLAWALAGVPGGKPDLLILELGANDGLRGLDPALTRQNMVKMLTDLQQQDIPVLLAGMMAPPNLGPDYAADFNPIYPELAAEFDAALYPFFLDGVAADPKLNQADGIHPTADGVAIIVSKLGPVVLSLLDPGGTP